MKILVLDNYDSFTFNLVQYIQEILGHKVEVIRNDAIDIERVADYDVVVLSPGPGVPKDAGIMPELIKKYAGTKPILGVCLGHQAIGEAFGGELENLTEVYHGVETPVKVTTQKSVLFKDLPEEMQVGRYHSWAVKTDNLPDCFEVTSVDTNGAIMSMRHKEHEVYGIQFHPESVMTPEGKQMLRNFLEHCKTVQATSVTM